MKDLAREIAERTGYVCETKEVEKANGIKLPAILVKETEDSRIGATIYVTPGMTADDVISAFEGVKADMYHAQNGSEQLLDFGSIKDKLTIRLYNKVTNAEVKMSAEKYGFDDLILVPYIDLEELSGSCRVSRGMLEYWGVSESELFELAIGNIESEISTVNEVLDVEDELDPQMYIISNKRKLFGASAILKAIDTFKEKWPYGFYVIPSTVHEMLVLPDFMPYEEVTAIIHAVNTEVIDPQEVLGNHAYHFAKEDN